MMSLLRLGFYTLLVPGIICAVLRQYACIEGASCGVLDDWLTAFDRKLLTRRQFR